MPSLILLAILLAACGSSSAPPPQPITPAPPPRPVDAVPVDAAPAMATPEQCTELFGHLVDLELEQGGVTSGAERATTRRHLMEYKGPEFLASCAKTTQERVACAIAAPTLARVEACDAADGSAAPP